MDDMQLLTYKLRHKTGDRRFTSRKQKHTAKPRKATWTNWQILSRNGLVKHLRPNEGEWKQVSRWVGVEKGVAECGTNDDSHNTADHSEKMTIITV